MKGGSKAHPLLTSCSRYVPMPLWGTFEEFRAVGRGMSATKQILSASADLNLGRATFAEAVRQRPTQRILLRHKTPVIEEYKQ
jgi:hypothetical protein